MSTLTVPVTHDSMEEFLWTWAPSTPQKAEDLSYTEISSAQGTITAFNKEMSYSSQVTGVAVVTPVPTMNIGR